MELSNQELSVAVQLFDIAVRAQGLEAAEAAVVLAKKFSAELKERNEKAAEPDPETESEEALEE